MLIILMSLVSLAATTNGADVSCPDNSHFIGDRSCLHMHPVKSAELEQIRKSSEMAAETCSRLQLGQLNWNLPKVNTTTRRKNIGRRLVKYAAEKLPVNSDRPWIWLGLRRHPDQMHKSPSDESTWYWTMDNTTLSMKTVLGEDFWETDQPKNEAGNELCAIASIIPNEMDEDQQLQFADTFCNEPANINNGTTAEQPPNIIGVACTAEIPVPPKVSKSITDQWWFYLLCALLVALPIVTAIVVTICCIRRKRQHRSRRQGSRKQKKATFRSRGSSSSDGQSHTGDSFSFIERQQNRPKIGYVPPPMLPSKMTSTASDEEETVYSNVLGIQNESKKKCAPKQLVKK